MDDRRRTISSEEQMIGEALMRVSNTLEAQRLTKSLDYQEKLRRRSNIRLIIVICCLMVAFMMVGVGGALLFVLWRYADPVLDTVMPFLKGMFGDFGIIWDGLVESATYMPVMVEQLTRILESMCIMLEGISSIDLAGMMKYLTAMLGTMTGMIADLGNAMDSIGPMLGELIKSMSNMMSGFSISGLLESFGMGDMVPAIGQLMSAMTEMMGSMASGMGAVADGMAAADPDVLKDGTTTLLNNMGAALGAAGNAIDPEEAGNMVADMGSAMGSMIAGFNSIAGLLERLGGLFG